MNKYDAVLYIVPEENVLENNDPKIYAKKGHLGPDKAFNVHTNWDDPKLYNAYSFGRSIQQGLSSLGDGFSCRVTDFAKWVVVEVSHHNILTGRTASKTFLIVFQQDNSGIVLSTANRYRTISGVSQAISYIRTSMSTLQGSNQSKI
jgi:hypothetical protein